MLRLFVDLYLEFINENAFEFGVENDNEVEVENENDDNAEFEPGEMFIILNLLNPRLVSRYRTVVVCTLDIIIDPDELDSILYYSVQK